MSALFGQCLRGILKQKNLSQVQAAQILGWSQRTVSYYCRSEKPPRAHVLEHIILKLGVDPTKTPSILEVTQRIMATPIPPSPVAKYLRAEARRLRATADSLDTQANALDGLPPPDRQ